MVETHKNEGETMNFTNIVLKTNIGKMPESCGECRLRTTMLSSIDIMEAELLTGKMIRNWKRGISCIFGMNVQDNVNANSRHEDCPLMELKGCF